MSVKFNTENKELYFFFLVLYVYCNIVSIIYIVNYILYYKCHKGTIEMIGIFILFFCYN